MQKTLVNVYIDGPNLLGAVSELRKKRVWLDPVRLAALLVSPEQKEIKIIYYCETPYAQNLHNPKAFSNQQSFFGKIHAYVKTGKVIHIKGHYRIELNKVPTFILNQLPSPMRKRLESISWKKPIEKGGDVGLAVQLVRDAFRGEFDQAILVSADQDFAPAVNDVTSDAKKKVSIAYVHNTYRTAKALRNRCPSAEFIQITRKMIERCELE